MYNEIEAYLLENYLKSILKEKYISVNSYYIHNVYNTIPISYSIGTDENKRNYVASKEDYLDWKKTCSRTKKIKKLKDGIYTRTK